MITVIAAVIIGTLVWRGVIWWLDRGPPHDPPDWWRPR